MKKFRTALLLTGTAGLLTAGLSTPALAASSAVSTVCMIDVNQIINYDLQEENNDGDEIKLKLGSTMFGAWDFGAGWSRTDSLGEPQASFTGSLTMTLYEVDALTRSTIESHSVACSPGGGTAEFEGNGAGYLMHYIVRTI